MKKNMFTTCTILLGMLVATAHPNMPDKELTTEAKLLSATLFFNGVQLQNEASANISSGKTLLKIKNISSYADEKSIQVSGQGTFTILSVNYKSNPQKPEDTDEYKKLKKELEDIDKKIVEERTWIDILQKKEAFYNANMNVTSTTQVITVEQLKALGDTYSKTIETVRFAIIEKQKKIEDIEKDRKTLNEKLNLLSSGQAGSIGEVWVLLSSNTALTAKFSISYFTYNAGWYPSYDVRVNKLNEPMNLTYKANIYQNSGLDWKNIKLKCSNATPYQQGNEPELTPYYLDFGNSYGTLRSNTPNNTNITQVTGVVRDAQTGESLIGTVVAIKGTNYGTTTDVDGKFKLNIPTGSNTLEIKYIGYNTREVYVNNNYIVVDMQAMETQLDEVTITSNKIDAMSIKKTPGVVSSSYYAKKSKKNTSYQNARFLDGDNSGITDVQSVSAATSIDFDITEPYSIKSDGAIITVDMQQTTMTVAYEYHATPKVEPSAFLIAKIADWEKYNLLSGEANLYIENTFVGKSNIDVNQIEDTLSISLGRDKNMVVKREKVKDFTHKRFLGSNITVERAWKISIKNNKNTTCQLFITDQIPFSENKDITVEKIDISGAKENTTNGMLEWKLEIPSNESRELNIKYSVKYPKNNRLIVE